MNGKAWWKKTHLSSIYNSVDGLGYTISFSLGFKRSLVYHNPLKQDKRHIYTEPISSHQQTHQWDLLKLIHTLWRWCWDSRWSRNGKTEKSDGTSTHTHGHYVFFVKIEALTLNILSWHASQKVGLKIHFVLYHIYTQRDKRSLIAEKQPTQGQCQSSSFFQLDSTSSFSSLHVAPRFSAQIFKSNICSRILLPDSLESSALSSLHCEMSTGIINPIMIMVSNDEILWIMQIVNPCPKSNSELSRSFVNALFRVHWGRDGVKKIGFKGKRE